MPYNLDAGVGPISATTRCRTWRSYVASFIPDFANPERNPKPVELEGGQGLEQG
jgi:hypothetical protein